MFAPRLGNPARCVLRRGRERGCPAPLAARRWFCLASGPRDPRNAVVKIFNTRQRPGWTVPWQDQPVESSSGSGALIRVRLGPSGEERHAILTAAHVVADTRYLQVQRSTDRFSGEKFRARLWAVCHQADLALLVVEDQSAVEGMTALELASAEELPRVFDKVRVVGYPVGGDACSVTEGVVSRVEVQEYSHSLRAGLALTVDAAINSGNSGGPLVDVESARIVGVAFQKLVARGVELQGHAVPAPLIWHFLEEAAAGAAEAAAQKAAAPQLAPPQVVRMPTLGCDYQSTEPVALRRFLGLGDRKGILVIRLHHGVDEPPPALRKGDVILDFKGYKIDEQGFCNFLGRRVHFAAVRDLCRVGERVPMTVWRDGEEVSIEHVLQPTQHLVPRGQFDVRPRFFMCGGLVLQPLSFDYLQGWNPNERPAHLQDAFLGGHLSPERSEVVMISQILADEVNAGYDSGWVGAPLVESVNGEKVRDLRHLVDIVRRARSAPSEAGFLVFDVAMSGGPFRLVLPLDGLDEADERVCGIYGVPRSCCSEHYVE
eukprot:TRINITY_DN19862_c0_g1_i1.p1 TRINITY_DN19862_c0_g1~~TRINITY_DN19862_c0_g1_i1.p1  ORF type:complete len:555 (-),score=111.44 TRINITY_DN19862_c0_g1_i1:54-1685(-)